MGDKGKFIPAGASGIAMRSGEVMNSQRAPSPPQTPLSADQLWQHAVQPKRGFEARPYNSDDSYRMNPQWKLGAGPSAGPLSGNRLDDGVKGGPVGFGVDTVGSVQLIDAEGKRSWIATGHFVNGGPVFHAEAVSLDALRQQAPKRLDGSHVMVVVDQEVCPYCEDRLRDYAKEVGADFIEIYHPRLENRATKVGSGVMNTPKISSQNSFMDVRPRPPVSVRLEQTIPIRRPPSGGSPAGQLNELGPPTLADAEIRTAVTGACLHLLGSAALMIFQDKFKDHMLGEIERMPRAKVDRSTAREFFGNPQTAKAMRVIDVLNKNVEPFAIDLADHHKRVIPTAVFELLLLRGSAIPDDERLAFLSGLGKELDAYDKDLETAQDNLEAAQKISGGAIEAAKAAEDLAKLIENPMTFKELFDTGFHPFELDDIINNLKNYAVRVRDTFQRLDGLHTQVTRQRDELFALRSEVNKLWRHSIMALIARNLKASQPVSYLPQHWAPGNSNKPQGPASDSKVTVTQESNSKPVPVAPLK